MHNLIVNRVIFAIPAITTKPTGSLHTGLAPGKVVNIGCNPPMNPFHIRTKRLDLIPATLEILEADRDDRQKLARLLSAAVPGSWPPPLLDEETLGEFIRMTAENADPLFITWYWVRDNPAEGARVLIGSGGIAPAPAHGTALIG